MIRIILFGFLTTQIVLCHCQFNETIRTGRPGQAIGPFSVGKSVIQTQTGVDYNSLKLNALIISQIQPNTVLRFGIGKKFELNFGYSHNFDKNKNNDSIQNRNGVQSYAFGSRINILDNVEKGSALGIQIGLRLPNPKPFETNFIAPKFLLIASKNYSNKISLLANFGFTYDGINPSPTGIYVLNFGYSLSPKIAIFAENYGSFTKDYINLNGMQELHF